MSLTLPSTEVTADEPARSALPPATRAAVVLALLSEGALSALSGRLATQNRASFAAALGGLSEIGPNEQRAVAATFAKRLADRRAGVSGGPVAADRLAERLYADEEAADGDEEAAEVPKTVWERIESMGAEAVAEGLAECPPVVLAIVLDAMPEAFAAEVAGLIEEAPAVASLVTMASRGEAPNPLALDAVEAMMEATFFGDAPAVKRVDTVHADRIAGLLNRLPTARREAALEAMASDIDEDLMAAVRERVLGFDDLAARLPRSAVPTVFREMDEAVLLEALSYAGARGSQSEGYLLGNISQRLAGQLRERLPENVPEAKGERAQAAVVGFVLELVGRGDAKLLDADGA